MKTVLVILSLVVASSAQPEPEVSPSEFCEECSLRRWNQKQLYGPEIDCPTFFYQCVKLHDGTWLRYRHDCAEGLYWREDILQCVEKYKGTCDDPCINKAVQIAGKHPGDDLSPADNCASYWVCSNYISYHYCCPEWMEFDPVSLECVLSTTCNKQDWLNCRGEWEEEVFTHPPVTHHDDGTCWILWNGEMIHVKGSQGETEFLQFDTLEDGSVVETVHTCAPGTAYDTTTCYCSTEGPVDVQPICPVILSVEFNLLDQSSEIFDQSAYNYYVHCTNPAAIANNDADFNGEQFCTIPGMMTHDLREGFWLEIDLEYSGQGGPVVNNRGDPNVDTNTRPWAEWALLVDVVNGNLLVRARSTHMTVATVQLGFESNRRATVGIHYCRGTLEVYIAYQDDGELSDGSNQVAEANFAWMHHCPWAFGHDTEGDRFFNGHIYAAYLRQGCDCE